MNRANPLVSLLLPIATLFGCGAESMFVARDEADQGANEENPDGDTGGIDDESGASLIRVDVYPSSSGPTLEPQSVVVGLDSETTNLEIELPAPISVRGEITGYVATPPSAIDVPGDTVPVIAQVLLQQDEGVAGGETVSDADGDFQLEITPGSDYTLAILPIDPSTVPFLIAGGLSLEDDQRLDEDLMNLGDGVPVYGAVKKSDGTPVRTEVALVDPLTGLQGGVVETDESGWFELRALPGEYELIVLGDPSRAVPSLSADIVATETEGARLDVDMGEYEAVTLDCDVLDSTGEPVSNVAVRFTSIELQDPEWSLQVDAETDSSGVLFTRLLPGTWSVEFIPSYDSGLSPVSMNLEITGELDLDDPVVLPPLATLSGRVVDPQGEALGGVIVSAREQGFDRRTWYGTTESDGSFSFDAPAVRLDLTFTPATDRVAILTLESDPSAEQIGDVVLPYGQEVSGTLSTPDGAVVPYAIVELRDAATQELLGTTLSNSSGAFSARISP